MSGYTDLSTNFENNRNCLRRIARHNEQEFSKDSIVNVMEKFVKTVSVMDDTILVPCRLMDLQVGDATDITPVSQKSQLHHHHQSNSGGHNHHHHHASNGINRSRKDRNATVHEFLNSADLFNLYTMLNALKNDLLWTRNDDDEDDSNKSTNNINVDNTNTTRQNLTTSVSIAESETSETSEQQQQNQQPNQQQKLSSSSVTNRQISSSSTTSNVSETSTTSSTSSSSSSSSTSAVATATTQTIKGHIRRPSTASMASSNSTSNLSDSESEISNENDSGIEYEGHCSGSRASTSGGSSTTSNSKNCTNLDKATELARQCRTHLNGLYRCLEQMTEAANYLTARYQSDIGPV